MGGDFLRYVGDPDIHDGVIIKVDHHENEASVLIKGFSGKMLTVAFFGLKSIKSNKPEGMILYSLSEMRCDKQHRHFVFTNTEDEDDAYLEIVAEEIKVIKTV